MATLPVSEFVEPLVSVEEYLQTSYRPDCEFVDGGIEERNVGEIEHGFLQALLAQLFLNNRRTWGTLAFTDVRLQIAAERFRVPDVSVLVTGKPEERILVRPPLIVIEILSPEDRLSRLQERIDDYLGFGVEHIWIFDPERRVAWFADRFGLHIPPSGELTVPETPIRVVLSELFAELERG
jgi:Uma2 family endonuclease